MEIATLLVLILFAFFPPILFLVWIRNTERFGREPWLVVIKVFLWGAVFAVIIAIILNAVFFTLFTEAVPVYVLFGSEQTLQTFLLAVVIAPFVEEAAKAVGVYGSAFSINEAEDGIVYGAASGLGFSATENLVYGLTALFILGPQASITLIVLRSVSSTLLHASATSATGYGIGKKIVSGGRRRVAPYYLLAVAMHASFNLFASLGEVYRETYGDSAAMLSLAAAIILAIVAFSVARSKIIKGERALKY